MPLLDDLLNPILGLLRWLLFPSGAMNSGKGVQTYALTQTRVTRIKKLREYEMDGTGVQDYALSRVLYLNPEQVRAFSAQALKISQDTRLSAEQSTMARQIYDLTSKAALKPTNEASSNNNYDTTVKIVYIPDPNKTTVMANGVDFILFDGLPVPSHWKTKQMGMVGNFEGASNEFDYDDPRFELSFYPPGQYRVTISSPGFAEKTWMIDALYDPNPPADEEPVEGEE